MNWHLFLSFILCRVAYSTEDDYTPEQNDDLVTEINSKAQCWEASLDSAKLLETIDDFKMRLGAIQKEVAVGYYNLGSDAPGDIQGDVDQLPRNFDSRLEWPECPSIARIVDQGPCGGCWATAATAVAADRYCIQNAGQENPSLSYRDVLTCSTAGDCGGGSQAEGYGYMKESGVPSGAMRDEEGWEQTCSPSPFEICNHHQRGTHEICPDSHTLDNPTCVPECQEGSSEDYQSDRYFVNEYWNLWSAEEIMNEVYLRGPVSIAFRVYKDYYFYLGGVYEHVAGEDIGLHAVKLIGWGYDEDCDADYWILANSWDPDWGEDGFIRIKKGDGECGIGNLGAEACSMQLSAQMEAKAKELLKAKAARTKAKEAKSVEEGEVGFLVWNVVAPRNVWFALATLGVFTSLYILFTLCYKIKTCCRTKKPDRVHKAQTYNTVPMDI